MTLVKSLAETISKVNDSFIHTKMLIQARVVNIFSTDDDPAKRVSFFFFFLVSLYPEGD